MPRAVSPPPEQALDGIGAIALHLEALIREMTATDGRPAQSVEVSKFSVWRAIHRRRDPLPAWRKFNGRRFASPSAVRAWLLRQGDLAQLILPGTSDPQ